MNLTDKCAVTGIGETEYSKNSGKSVIALQMEASLKAIADAGLTPNDIDGVIPYGNLEVVAEDFITNLGIQDLRYSAVTPLGGASAVAAIQAAVTAVASGVANHVLIPIGRNGASGERIGDRVQAMPQFRILGEYEMPSGNIAPPQLYAHMARRHMELYGTTSAQLAEIAVAVRSNAILNDNAVMTKPMTIEDHQNSRMISDPLRLFDCCLESDGAAAVIISASDRAKDLAQRPIYIMGVGEGHPDSPSIITQRPDITTLGTAKAGPRAFGMAGVTPKDIDVAEIYDCFTYIVMCQLEDLGFCEKGEGGDFVSNGRIALDGELPINTHGGLLSQSHIVGMNHVCELVKQLRGTGGKAQVANAEIGLVTGYGDMGDGSVAIMRN
ncbi:MAG: thiolase family protein [Rhodospirillaceae bacterium]|jgi:acetyl-CoA acetyltransferase|nr:thiolase family protein [Rhodospirillaceae bacterium]MBT5194809.1 thiolase family protein [Rhodospirillaceae bacterium]MBT5898215.1 thiolase family protein [Rhodospirillaceae bacterium]